MLHTPDGNVVAPELQDLARKLHEGDGIQWTGDPRLYLGIGVLTNTVTGQQGKRLEVWRHNEDGSDTLVGHWLMSEQMRVLYDLARMRADAPGHVDIVDAIEKENARKAEAESAKARESMYETLDHALHLDHDRNNPKNKHFFADKPIEVPKSPEAA